MKFGRNNAVLVTGGAKRIGREMALFLAKKGYDVAISYNSSDEFAIDLKEKIHQKFDVKCEIFKCDFADLNSAKSLMKDVLKKFPNLNLLINNGSIFNKSKFLPDLDSQAFININLHLTTPLILSNIFTQNIIEKKIQNAQIINMVDKNITRYKTSYFYYLLSKKFLFELTKMLAVEIAPEVRVNAVAPGFILNSVNEKNPENETKNLIKKIPLQKKGDIKNILQAIDFLLKNDFVTGQTLFIDGGASM
jgi:NAD(P)-dependent dehydrogenase (short-subunit alcohol dehydrogenase family)